MYGIKRKKLVVIGANDFQNQLLLCAKKKGIETFCFAWKEGAVGENTADHFYPVSIVEKERILEECKKIKPDGIVSIASDLAVITVNYVAEKLGLPGNGMESARISTNKYLMRKVFAENKDPSPAFCLSDELTEDVISELEFPLIVKPVDRSGSRGVTKVSSVQQLREAVSIAREVSFIHSAIIEEFVEGEEFSVEYISYHGQHIFLAVTKKYTTGDPHYIETGHLEPAVISDEVLKRIKDIVSHALDTLKIKNGASHSEIKISENGEIKIIEIGGRMGGDCIGSDLVRISTGFDFVGMVIDVAFGKKPVLQQICKPAVARVHFIFNEKDIERLADIKKNSPDTLYRVSEICPCKEMPVDSSTRWGYYITINEYNEVDLYAEGN